jgi:hypothetical protein
MGCAPFVRGPSTFGYVAYIDESGDDGLRRVRPLHKDGSSDWLVLPALVVKADKDRELVTWVKEIRGKLKQV